MWRGDVRAVLCLPGTMTRGGYLPSFGPGTVRRASSSARMGPWHCARSPAASSDQSRARFLSTYRTLSTSPGDTGAGGPGGGGGGPTPAGPSTRPRLAGGLSWWNETRGAHAPVYSCHSCKPVRHNGGRV